MKGNEYGNNAAGECQEIYRGRVVEVSYIKKRF